MCGLGQVVCDFERYFITWLFFITFTSYLYRIKESRGFIYHKKQTENMSDTKRAMVISGGGAKGAWGVGVAKALSLELGHHYHMSVGTSTGSLMSPLVVLRDFERLEDIYTSVTQKDIFNVNPFKSNGKIRMGRVAKRMLKGCETMGESKKLRETIKKFFHEDDFNKIRSEGLDFTAAVTSLTTSKVHYKSTADPNMTYEDMVDWAWASANTPVFMSNLHKDGEVFVDGGLRAFLPIQYATDNGADVIDVIVHNHPGFSTPHWKQKGNFLKLLGRVLSVYYAGIGDGNLLAGIQSIGLHKEHELNLYYMRPDEMHIIGESLVFNKEKMQKVLKLGYDSVVDGSVWKQTYTLKDGKISGPVTTGNTSLKT